MPRAKDYVEERVQLQFRLTTDLRDRLRVQADRRAVSVNYLIERAIEDAVVKWEREKKIAS
jgi:predicted HicB family RNase H-like nuclease